MERITKDQIRDLPLFAGLALANIHLIENEQSALKALELLKIQSCVGFDTESKPMFKKGEKSPGPTLIQLSTREQAFLFPTRFPAILEAVGAILSDNSIKKVGFGTKGDAKELRSSLGIELRNTEDLAKTARRFLSLKQDLGARAAVAMLLGFRLNKGAQTSNWGAYPLTEQQIKYAANDAYAALCVENKIHEMKSAKA